MYAVANLPSQVKRIPLTKYSHEGWESKSQENWKYKVSTTIVRTELNKQIVLYDLEKTQSSFIKVPLTSKWGRIHTLGGNLKSTLSY